MGLLKKVEREILFRKNLKLFEERLLPVAEAIKKVKSSLKIIERDSKIDAFIHDVSIYGGDAFGLVEKQLEIFEKLEPKLFSSVSLEPPPEDRKDIVAYRYTTEILKLTKDFYEPPKLQERFIPLLIIVGVGFGIHIKNLLERYEVQNLIIVDIPLYFKLSFYWLDWEWVFEYFSPKSKRQLHIVLLDNKYAQKHPDEAYEPILKAIQGMNPAVAFYGYYFQHLEYEPPLRVVDWLRKHPMLRQFFYGYFDDELWSLDWTIEKVLRGIPLYYGDVKVPKGIPAFVLGAGPSLDKSLDTIEKYKDKAILISCGSTITSLQRAGIKPDIHVELERTKYTYDVLSEVDREFLRGIFLVTSNTVWTECFDLFDEGGFVLKLNDTGANMLRYFVDAPQIGNMGPTVTAMGVSLSARLGFEEVYLFGVDLGSKDKKLHHSKLSNYYKPGSMLYKTKVEFQRTAPGNFGGLVYTNIFFEETAYAMHKVIHEYNIRVYNLSDGIRIEGAIPLDPEDMLIEKNIDKKQVLELIKRNFRKDYKVDPRNILENLYKIFDNFESALYLIQKSANRREALYTMALLENYLQALGDIAYVLVFHNTYQWSLAVIGHILNTGEEEIKDFMEAFLRIYTDFIKEVKGSIRSLIDKHYSM
ncbi:MAG: 6-hydroxymethylpterin diphosphokinase MptE-like protein [Aquificaceae bacterium]